MSNALTALKVVMGDIDFTKGACRMTDMVGACLSKEALALAHAALENPTPSQPASLEQTLKSIVALCENPHWDNTRRWKIAELAGKAQVELAFALAVKTDFKLEAFKSLDQSGIDITGPLTNTDDRDVEVELTYNPATKLHVLYLHAFGRTIVRICRVNVTITDNTK